MRGKTPAHLWKVLEVFYWIGLFGDTSMPHDRVLERYWRCDAERGGETGVPLAHFPARLRMMVPGIKKRRVENDENDRRNLVARPEGCNSHWSSYRERRLAAGRDHNRHCQEPYADRNGVGSVSERRPRPPRDPPRIGANLPGLCKA